MNITNELKKLETRQEEQYAGDQAVKAVILLENKDAQDDMRLAKALGANNSIMRAVESKGRKIQLDDLRGKYKGDVFTREQIKNVARRYNLRFLKTQHYCGSIPVETLSKIKSFAAETETAITAGNIEGNFFILAPDKCFNLNMVKKMRKDPDPALFYRIDGDHYRMIHQWGSDFTIFNRINGFMHESREKFFLSLITMVALVSFSLIHFLGGSAWFYLIDIPLIGLSSLFAFNDDITDDYNYHEVKWDSTIKMYR